MALDTASRPTDPAGVTGQLAGWLSDLAYDQIPETARERAKYLTLDGIGCALFGARLPWSARAVKVLTELEPSGGQDPASSCRVIGWGLRTTAPTAALLNSTFIQGFELDDYHPWGPLHSASIVVPALFAAIDRERKSVTGRDFLVSAIAGYEVGPRVGMALHGRQMLSRGWHSGAVFGTHAAAASVGHFLGLNGAQMEDALGLAGTQSCGLMAAQFEAMSKRMHHGFATRSGLYGAYLAQGGYTGIKRVFEREYGGFLSTFGEGHDPDHSQISKGLGEKWETEEITIKPYAAMGALHAPLDAILKLRNEEGLTADQVDHIAIEMSHSAFHHGGWPAERPLNEIGAQMNVAYAVAAALIDGAALAQQFSPSRVDSQDIWDLIERIEPRHNPDFDSLPGDQRQATRMVVTRKDGTTLETYVPLSSGVANPLSNEAIVEKFRAITEGVVDPQRQAEIIRMVAELETLPDVSDLIELLARPVNDPF